jgi:CRISPR/Cas system Type II protein with McrA/HNH and RuvC-like nuclease domain
MAKIFTQVFSRDNHRCVYCGKYLLLDFETFYSAEKDHLVPRSKDGNEEVENFVLACNVCNRFKSNYKPEFELTANNREQYIHDIRKYVMSRRAHHMETFLWWVNGNGEKAYAEHLFKQNKTIQSPLTQE